MKAVGFKNFRNFEEFPMMPIEGVTFLVGQNNSGKSTFTKACRFLAEQLKNCFEPDYVGYDCFSAPRVSFLDTCRTYERAVNANHNGDLEFSCSAGYFNIIVRFRIPKGDQSSIHEKAYVSYIQIEDTIDDFIWSYDYTTKQITLNYSGKLLANMVKFWALELGKRGPFGIHKDQLLEDLELSESLSKLQENKDEIERIKTQRRAEIENYRLIEEKYLALTERKEVSLQGSEPLKVFDIRGYTFDLVKESIDLNMDRERDSSFGVQIMFFDGLLKSLYEAVSSEVLYYPASESPMHSYFSVNDISNNIVNSKIFAYYQSEHKVGRKKWICKWMQNFGIGQDFSIDLVNSEFLGIEIINMQGNKVPLSDQGRGAVQLFLLLLRVNMLRKENYYDPLGCSEEEYDFNEYAVADRNRSFPDGDKRYRMIKSKTLIFEEPEQNLHPALQSKLADLFADIHKTFGYNIIVETHSEYLIRRTQALIASGEVPFDKNPFHVYYFPQGALPYDMEYQESGLFRRKFDSGFFDEASKSQMDIIRRIREDEHV